MISITTWALLCSALPLTTNWSIDEKNVARNATLTQDSTRLDVVVGNQEQQIKQFKEELQQAVKKRNEAHVVTLQEICKLMARFTINL